MRSYKVYIDSAAWVCEGNFVGLAQLYRYLLENDHRIVDNPVKADFIIINSCGLSKSRSDLSINLFENYYSQKKENAKIIMFGCIVKIDKKRIDPLDLYPIDFYEEYKFDELFYKNIKFEDINPYIDEKTKLELLQGKNLFKFTKIVSFFFSRLLFPFSKRVRLNYEKMIDSITYKKKLFVEIAKGCTGNCSYCMIKKARGNVVSRPINDIISDIEKLYDPSKNLFLVADDCGCYGVDIGKNFFNLIYEIHKKYPDLNFEVNYLNPYWLQRCANEYIQLFKDVNIIMASIPVQSGSNKILKNMNRNYDINRIIELLKKIKEVSPKTLTYSHFMLGFPGENTFDFIKTIYCAMQFDIPVAFGYSENKDAESSKIPQHKSSITLTMRYIIFLLISNLIIFYKLLKYQRDN